MIDSTIKLLREIRDRLPLGEVLHHDPLPKWGTLHDGLELPLVLATIPSVPLDIRRFGLDFTEAWKHDTHHYTGGLLLIQVDSIKPPAEIFFGAEVQVTGFISGVPDILAVAAVNSNSGPLSVAFARPYDFVRVSARQLVNGLPNNTTDSQLLMCAVTARLER